ncbi:helix-turn-helix domain-containing protein [Lysinibacillus fusiformis]|uniref:winged helix-turn-helix transcriptional regulator n=1 Tax=Lysinibacillus fusiformis TaxID=28031 RepID=UPI0000F36312|nr:helix-turn-helix domain-containing protein [Lysinibacillus fusiformis]EAZ83714.1 transcriptional regulator [Bacillus sp. B14905]MED4074969.1 helix-turn-helix domain-containing protein [Lysinibacillus fusiformis]
MSELNNNYIKHHKQRPFDFTLSLIGGKWKMKIMYELSSDTVLRYGELKRQIPAITHKMLSSQLRELEDSGIVHRKEYPQIPPKVEYSLTLKGKSLMPILEEMCKWGVANQI